MLPQRNKDLFDFENLNFQEIYNDPEYFYSNKNGLKAVIVSMNPQDYVSIILKHSKIKLSQEKLDKINEGYKQNVKFPVPYLTFGGRDSDDDYRFGQEGLHRAYFFKSIGEKTIPVEIRYRDDDEKLPYEIRKYLNISYVDKNYKQFLEVKDELDFAKWKKDSLDFRAGTYNQYSLFDLAKKHFDFYKEEALYKNQREYLSSLEKAINSGLTLKEETLLKDSSLNNESDKNFSSKKTRKQR